MRGAEVLGRGGAVDEPLGEAELEQEVGALLGAAAARRARGAGRRPRSPAAPLAQRGRPRRRAARPPPRPRRVGGALSELRGDRSAGAPVAAQHARRRGRAASSRSPAGSAAVDGVAHERVDEAERRLGRAGSPRGRGRPKASADAAARRGRSARRPPARSALVAEHRDGAGDAIASGGSRARRSSDGARHGARADVAHAPGVSSRPVARRSDSSAARSSRSSSGLPPVVSWQAAQNASVGVGPSRSRTTRVDRLGRQRRRADGRPSTGRGRSRRAAPASAACSPVRSVATTRTGSPSRRRTR